MYTNYSNSIIFNAMNNSINGKTTSNNTLYPISHQQIKRECIRDHKSYIKSYINHQIENTILNHNGNVNRYEQMKNVMKDITNHHPQLMSYILNPENSKPYTDHMHKYIMPANGQTHIGGTKTEMTNIIDAVRNIFDRIKKLDLANEKKITSDLIGKMEEIQTSLKSINDDEKEKFLVSPEKVINNLNTIITTLNQSDPTKPEFKQLNHVVTLYSPVIKFEDNTFQNVIYVKEIMSKNIDNFTNIVITDEDVKRIVKIILESNNQKELTNNLQFIRNKDMSAILTYIKSYTGDFNSLRRDIFHKYIIENIQTTYETKSIIDRCNTDKAIIDDKNTELKQLIKILTDSTNKTNEYLYGNERKEQEFIAIRSNILPKIRTIVSIINFQSQQQPNEFTQNSNLKQIVQDNKKIYETTKILITYLNDYERKPNKEEIFKQFILECKNTDINKQILLYNEKQTNDAIKNFIIEYNKKMNTVSGKQYVTDLNVFMADMYRKLLNYYYTNKPPNIDIEKLKTIEETNKYTSIIRALNIKKFQDVANAKDLTKEFLKQKSSFDEILKFNYHPSNQNAATITDVIKKDEYFTSRLSKNITKDDEARLFIHQYNKFMNINTFDSFLLMGLGLPTEIQLIPFNYYTKDYTERIYNNIFETPSDFEVTKQKIAMLNEMIEDEYTMVYNPDFSKIGKTQIQSKQHGGSLQYGGTTEEIIDCMLELARSHSNFLIDVENYKKEKDNYEITYANVYSYIRFLILIATNQFFTENYVVYNFMNKGTVELYKRIISKIDNSLSENTSEPQIEFIKKYYYVIIKRLNSFVKHLSKFMTNPLDIIDIRNIHSIEGLPITTEIKNDMLLLNYFKPIIESYNETFQDKITVYARLNDMVGEIDYASKVFVSDHEMLKNTGCSFDVGKKVCSKNPSITEMSGNSSIMWTVCEKCINAVEKRECKEDTPTKFTEVYDSVNFPENNDISKYMTLETQLAKKQGVCLMTYGYSGTGKTYTLFGSSKSEKNGILQSTLANINGLYKVEFRLFEIYGRGLPYDFYWKDRMNDIFHNIYHYRLNIKNKEIVVNDEAKDDLVEIKAKDFSAYINEGKTQKHAYDTIKQDYKIENTYVSIKGGDDIKEVFGKFETFTKSVDDYRKGKGNSRVSNIKRIRETLNNPESSRSILIYDFTLYVGEYSEKEKKEDGVKFLIIDLPGREDINQTYIEPYFKNEHLQFILKDDVKDQTVTINEKRDTKNLNIERKKMIITCMALNPMALAVFHPEIIIKRVNDEEKIDIRHDIYGPIITDEVKTPIKITDHKINESKTEGKNKLSLIADLDESKWILKPKTMNVLTNKIFGYDTNKQLSGVCAVFVVYRLILLNNFNLLEDIYKLILEEEINKPVTNYNIDTSNNSNALYGILFGLLQDQFKGETTADKINKWIGDVTNHKKVPGEKNIDYIERNELAIKQMNDHKNSENIAKIKTILKEIFNYDYYMTPLEGIYINENIRGLIKYLAARLISNISTKREKPDVLIEEKSKQKTMILSDQRNIARCWLISRTDEEMKTLYKDGKRTNLEYMIELFGLEEKYNQSSSFFPGVITDGQKQIFSNNIYSGLYTKSGDKIELNLVQVVKQQQYLLSTYEPDKIFNFDKPIITNILSPYIMTEGKEQSEEEQTILIKDFKLFYLFANNVDNQITQFKCKHQIDLLNITHDFIDTITK
jgi:hypothetical protein